MRLIWVGSIVSFECVCTCVSAIMCISSLTVWCGAVCDVYLWIKIMENMRGICFVLLQTLKSLKKINPLRQNPLHLQCMIHVHVACYTVQTALIQCIWVIPFVTCVLYQNTKLVNTLKITIQPVRHPLLYSETSKMMFK